ncbi:NAD(P)-binding protein [Wolfiporia cocos MD-104 SS10]|uniref:NAD(P)-binding protein n=1 Tax=Wolfiporia cocos (strain MD-104) TaxID=742152 RepID=A0A2H3JSL2_WOLCO|nr:NAD(P)-binding protein [Wolfiporia cocos MD-104 SS10]
MASASTRIAAMYEMAVKYSDGFPHRRTDKLVAPVDSTSRDVVLVTGTTGSLGCHLLEAMVFSPDIARVYAFNRRARDGTALHARQAVALEERGIDSRILDLPKIVLLEGDLTKVTWGLSDDMFNEVQHSVTHIIHNAWPVDFVAKLSAFEPAIKSLRSLIDFALASPLPVAPRLLFTSSQCVLQRTSLPFNLLASRTNYGSHHSGAPRDFSVPEGPVDPSLAMTNGYAEAKWVCEQIVYTAAAHTTLDPIVVRVGQLSGGRAGAWAADEWIPAMVQSAPHVGGLPDDSRIVDFLPFDIGAAAVLDFLHAPRTIDTTHVVHPRGVSWHSIAATVASELGVPLISVEEWLRRLQALAAASPSQSHKSQTSPGAEERHALPRLYALQLIPVYQNLLATLDTGRMAMGFPDVEVTQTLRASPTLADSTLRDVGADDVRRWLAYWRRVGMLERPRAQQYRL